MSRTISAIRTRVAHKRDRSHVESTITTWNWKAKSSGRPTKFDLHGSRNGKDNGRPNADTCGSPAGGDGQRGDLQKGDQNDEDKLEDTQVLEKICEETSTANFSHVPIIAMPFLVVLALEQKPFWGQLVRVDLVWNIRREPSWVVVLAGQRFESGSVIDILDNE